MRRELRKPHAYFPIILEHSDFSSASPICSHCVQHPAPYGQVYKLRKAGDFGAALCGKAGYCDNTGIEKAKQGRKAAKAAAEKEKKKKEDEKEKKKAEKQAKIVRGSSANSSELVISYPLPLH